MRDGRWREVRGGYEVDLLPGEHPAVKTGEQPVRLMIPYREAKPSPDGRAHVCINPATKAFLCAFWPIGGV